MGNWLQRSRAERSFVKREHNKELRSTIATESSSGYGSVSNSVIRDAGPPGRSNFNKRKILKNFRYLKRELEPDPLIDRFVQDDYFDDFHIDTLASEPRKIMKNDVFLRMLLRLPSEAFKKFLEYLSEQDVQQDYIRVRLESSVEENTFDLPGVQFSLPDVKQNLVAYKNLLLEQLEPELIADFFLEFEVLTVSEYEDVIQPFLSRREKCKLLLHLISSGRPEHEEEGYKVLVFALKEIKRNDLADLLTQHDNFPTQGTHDASSHERKACTRQLKVVSEPTNCDKTSLSAINEHVTGNRDLYLLVRVKGLGREHEERIIDELKTSGMQSLNGHLILHASAVVQKIDRGSIIFEIHICNSRYRASIGNHGFSIVKTVVELVEMALNQQGVARILSPSEIKLQISIKPLFTSSLGDSGKPFRLIKHRDHLADNIQVHTFLDSMLRERISFSKDELSAMYFRRGKSSKDANYMLIDHVVTKKKIAIAAFTDTLKKTNRTLYATLLPEFPPRHESDKRIYQIARNMEGYFEDLLDNISPGVIANACRSLPLSSSTFATLEREHDRVVRTKALLLGVMELGPYNRYMFIKILHYYQQLPTATLENEDLRESVIFPELKHLDKRVNLGRFSFDSPQFSKQGKHVPEESVTRRVLENALEKTGQPGTKDESRDSAYESIRSDNHSIHEVRSDVYKLVMKKERI
ncbi:uncharacterized protein LOC128210207 isoform X2 [Mya arenaria]|uniref:uncharacterized protein LOC128210207 isoform X2 n=1 Tax=Mya arenaria TaxID=6604 RepID=UPI0022E588F9|nr:uncharacterized protein LOC128210207 isoform X2 [Mya arenaria]